MRFGWFLAVGMACVGACSSSGSSGGPGLDGGSNCSGTSCSSLGDCPGIQCKCPGSKFVATIRTCRKGCCPTNCNEACGVVGTGGGSGSGGSASGGFGNFGAFGGTAGQDGGAGAAGAAGIGGAAGNDAGLGDAGVVVADSDTHVLFFDAAAPSGTYWGILRHAVKLKGTSSWVMSIIDSGINSSMSSTYAIQEMVLDASGHPNVAYSHFRTKTLRFARWDGSSWVQMDGSFGYDVLDSNVDTTGIGKHFITMYNGKPEIAFRQGSTLKRYSWSGSAWQGTLVLDTTPPTGIANPGGAPALAFDSSGFAHIAHHDHGGYQLHYARQSASGWSNELLGFSPKQSAQYKHIALDSVERPHIVFKFGYTRWNGSAWVKADGTAGYDAYDTGFISAGLSPQGEFIVGHRVGSAIELVRKTLAGATWANEGQVHPGPHTGAAFTADATGKVHAVVSEGTTGNNVLTYITKSGGGWVGEQFFGPGGNSRLLHPSIAVR